VAILKKYLKNVKFLQLFYIRFPRRFAPRNDRLGFFDTLKSRAFALLLKHTHHERGIIVYSNTFDTVLYHSKSQYRKHTTNVIGMLYSSILSGLHPTFSLNQAVDSLALHSILIDDSQSQFLKLVENKTIRIARYKKADERITDAIDEYLIPKLTNQMYCEFSSLPFLNKDNKHYSNQQKKLILTELKNNLLSSDPVSLTAFHDTAPDHEKYLRCWIDNIKRLKRAVNSGYNPGYIPPPSKSTDNEKLSEKVINVIKRTRTEAESIESKFCLEELIAFEECLNKAKGNKDINTRSRMYRIIRELGCDKPQRNELTALIDICYNEIVAKSIADTEDDIMINNHKIQYAGNYLEAEKVTDKEKQKLSLISNSANYKPNILTWSDLNEILDIVNRKYSNNKDLAIWYQIMQDTLSEKGIKHVKTNRNKLLTGTFAYICSLPSTVYGLLNGLTDGDPTGFALAGINFLGSTLFNIVLSSYQKASDLTDAQKKLSVYKHAEELLTQTALLKRDYNNPQK